MTDLQQNAIFGNWKREIAKYPTYLNDLQPTEYQIEKFLEFLNKRILEIQKMIVEVLNANPGLKHGYSPGRYNNPEHEELLSVKKTVLEWKENKGKIKANSIVECLDIFLASDESPSSFTVPGNIMDLKPVQAPENDETVKDTDIPPKATGSPKKPQNYKGIIHALAYVLEMKATGGKIPFGERERLEKIGESRIDEAVKKGFKSLSPNTFYKRVGKCENWSAEKEYTKGAGYGWQEKVLQLVNEKHKEIVKNYIESNIH